MIPKPILLPKERWPQELLEIPEPPKQLWITGTLPDEKYIRLTVIGSRKYTNYGKDACEKLIAGLRGYPITIISGLALGIDAIAHRAALSAGLPCIAVPGSGLDEKVLYPATNISLARQILESGGCLLSEYDPGFRATIWSFPRRNRIEAGLSKAVLIIEAEEKSGTLITARLATDYNRDVLAVPGSIFSDNSRGTHMLIRLGATPIRNSEDILEALGFDISKKKEERPIDQIPKDCSPEELTILKLLNEPLARDELIRRAGFPISQTNGLLSIMEIKGLIKESLGEIRKS